MNAECVLCSMFVFVLSRGVIGYSILHFEAQGAKDSIHYIYYIYVYNIYWTLALMGDSMIRSSPWLYIYS